MKEVDYVRVTNLASMRSAQSCLREVMPVEGDCVMGGLDKVRLRLSLLIDEQLALIAIDDDDEASE